ncbi:MAG: hypothetical protein O9353_08235 [Bacteroidia bacterium]|nr:hypothetical protein [Bacteroidia bacterium]
MPDLEKIAKVLLRENLINEEDTASLHFSISAHDTPLPFDQIWGIYRIRLNIAEDNANEALKSQLTRFINDLKKHKDQKVLKLVQVRAKREFFAFMDADYTKVVCYLFLTG